VRMIVGVTMAGECGDELHYSSPESGSSGTCVST